MHVEHNAKAIIFSLGYALLQMIQSFNNMVVLSLRRAVDLLGGDRSRVVSGGVVNGRYPMCVILIIQVPV